MSLQHVVYLSLGSNLGNSQEAIKACLQHIHHEIGSVIKVSSLYKTKAMGFVGNDFLNVVAKVHTQLTYRKLFQKLQKLEKTSGRVKTQLGYENRVIDIDMIAFDELIINDEDLQIPHAKMHERDFVLVPLIELDAHWTHPVSKLSAKELLKHISEKTLVSLITAKDISPLKSWSSSLKYLVIEGNIGAGKTTLATKVAEDYRAKLVLERFADNPFLPKFYADKTRYAFPLEMSFLADRFKQINDDLAQFDLFKDFIVSDYHIFKSLIFAQVTLQEDEMKLYKTMFDIIHKDVPKPDLYVYLHQSTEELLANIKKRGRQYEKNIDPNYLNQINERYLNFFKTHHEFPIHIIDVSHKDFVKNQSDYREIISEIDGLMH